jgi:hypothetical protein
MAKVPQPAQKVTVSERKATMNTAGIDASVPQL